MGCVRKSSLILILLLFLGLLAYPLQSRAQESCQKILTKKSSSIKLEFQTLKPLSETGVFEIQDTAHQLYVVRFASSVADTEFEVIASHFLRQFLNHPPPAVHTLPTNMRKPILDEIQAHHPRIYMSLEMAGMVVWKQAPGLLGLPASITRKSSDLTGKHVLRDLGFSNLPFLAHSIANRSDTYSDQIAAARREWNILPAETRSHYEQEFSRLFNLPHPPWTADVFSQWFEKLKDMPNKLGHDFVAVTLSKVPDHMLQQISEAWILYTILGIPDFHAGNWVYQNNTVVPIDAAQYMKFEYLKNPTINFSKLQQPFGFSSNFEALSYFMLKQASLEFTERLKSHGPDALIESFKNNPARKITPEMQQIFQQRLQTLLKLRDSLF